MKQQDSINQSNLFAGTEFTIEAVSIRFLIIILYLSATYVIGDMYSANLTSMLARPARGNVES